MANDLTARIFDIQRFSVHDGPGIRTTVFFTGCPLRCQWCHNPEGFSQNFILQYRASECIGCAECAAVCPNQAHLFDIEHFHTVDRGKCDMCGKCIDACPVNALSPSGYTITLDELTEKVLRDRDFYGADGGVTLSGGEVMCQWEFAATALKRFKSLGIKTAVDTSGYIEWEHLAETLPFTDLYLYDIKTATEELHIKYTGVSNKCILENLHRLDGTGKPIFIRVPVIPCVNDSDTEMKKIDDIIASLSSVKDVTKIPYHILGKNKYETLGLTAHDF